jgi:hypothetical protein
VARGPRNVSLRLPTPEPEEEASGRPPPRQAHGRRGRLLGPRAFDEFGDITAEPAEFETPPWVIGNAADEARDAA